MWDIELQMSVGDKVWSFAFNYMYTTNGPVFLGYAFKNGELGVSFRMRQSGEKWVLDNTEIPDWLKEVEDDLSQHILQSQFSRNKEK